MSVFPVTQAHKRTLTGDNWRQRVYAIQKAAQDGQRHRETDLIERAKAHLQRRGFAVYAASVIGKGKGWMVGTAGPIDDQALIDRAVRKGLTL